ncbi:hypothetical protein Patl1_03196 [Pistacia atlantica]|uniref:Uncharacterized protein n=1 Tax=Pistacia atlantica TaxID=434234 RepID=A0ACC1C6G4_9ROSI|nr:hypothetical protein Patl1_03196 [Pistacia atlantica]
MLRTRLLWVHGWVFSSGRCNCPLHL